jgi:methylated-DNA-[protein]-cysteine S-methyltransferase
LGNSLLEIATTYYKSPIGFIEIKGVNECIFRVRFIDDEPGQDEIPSGTYMINKCVEQLDGYFNRNLKRFDLKLAPEGTEFQKQVWELLKEIPFGHTRSYRQMAGIMGDYSTTRAIGNANSKNPIAIIIPCHRVIGTKGTLTGYAGGLHRKKWLLEHESGAHQTILF